MRKKVILFAPWIVSCAILALPVTAQESGSAGGIFQEIFDAVATWFASTADDLPDSAISTTGHPAGDEQELGPHTMPGGFMTPGDPG